MDFALETRIAELLPRSISKRLSVPYNILRAKRADREFNSRKLPNVTAIPDAPSHVVLCVVDALRSDHVTEDVMPFLSDFNGVNAVSAAPWTFPAVSSIMTGEYPNEHGAIRQSDTPDAATNHQTLPPKLEENKTGVTDILAGAGYETYGGFGNIMPFLALSGRFHNHSLHIQAPANEIIEKFSRWLLARSEAQTFSYLQFSDLHIPVDPPDEYWDLYEIDLEIPNLKTWDYTKTLESTPKVVRYRDHRKRLYRAAATYVDDQIESLHAHLTDELDDFLFIVTSDHGEAFWEMAEFDEENFTDSRPAYGVKHGGTPYEGLARVPILTDSDGVVEGGFRSLVDVAPTILNCVGASDTMDTSGYSLFQQLPEGRVPLIESVRYGYEKKAVYLDEWKLLVSRGDSSAFGFCLPEEKTVPMPEEVESTLQNILPEWPDGEGADQTISGHAKDRLEDLGYV